MMRMVGFFPSVPTQVNFESNYAPVNGQSAAVPASSIWAVCAGSAGPAARLSSQRRQKCRLRPRRQGRAAKQLPRGPAARNPEESLAAVSGPDDAVHLVNVRFQQVHCSSAKWMRCLDGSKSERLPRPSPPITPPPQQHDRDLHGQKRPAETIDALNGPNLNRRGPASPRPTATPGSPMSSSSARRPPPSSASRLICR